MKITTTTSTYIAALILALSFMVIGLSVLKSPIAPHFLVVESGSMDPTLPVGSLIITQKSDHYTPNEVITFTTFSKRDQSTTHRVVSRVSAERYITKGDANDVADLPLVHSETIIGKVVMVVPYLGYFSLFAKSLPGLILFLLIPAALLLVSELRALKRAVTFLKPRLIRPLEA